MITTKVAVSTCINRSVEGKHPTGGHRPAQVAGLTPSWTAPTFSLLDHQRAPALCPSSAECLWMLLRTDGHPPLSIGIKVGQLLPMERLGSDRRSGTLLEFLGFRRAIGKGAMSRVPKLNIEEREHISRSIDQGRSPAARRSGLSTPRYWIATPSSTGAAHVAGFSPGRAPHGPTARLRRVCEPHLCWPHPGTHPGRHSVRSAEKSSNDADPAVGLYHALNTPAAACKFAAVLEQRGALNVEKRHLLCRSWFTVETGRGLRRSSTWLRSRQVLLHP